MTRIRGGLTSVIMGDSEDVNDYGGGFNREPGWGSGA